MQQRPPSRPFTSCVRLMMRRTGGRQADDRVSLRSPSCVRRRQLAPAGDVLTAHRLRGGGLHSGRVNDAGPAAAAAQ